MKKEELRKKIIELLELTFSAGQMEPEAFSLPEFCEKKVNQILEDN